MARRVLYSQHAVERMVLRGITRGEVEAAPRSGSKSRQRDRIVAVYRYFEGVYAVPGDRILIITVKPRWQHGGAVSGRWEGGAFGPSESGRRCSESLRGSYDAEVCDECSEVFFTADSVDKIEARAKELGLWGLASRVKVARPGNSLVVRIPSPLVRYLKLRSGREVLGAPDQKHRRVLDLA